MTSEMPPFPLNSIIPQMPSVTVMLQESASKSTVTLE